MRRPRRAAGTPVTGKVVATTGAARGIGLAIAQRLAAAGARVALGDLDGELAALEAARLPGGAVGLRLDVTDHGSFTAFLDAVEARLGPVDVLVNNAGIMWVGAFDEEPEGAAERQMAVNFHGAARGVRLAVPRMRARGRGHVITVASAASRLAPAGEASYAATKHAVLGYHVAVREELRRTPVQLSIVLPIVVETELAAGTTHGKGKRLAPADVADAVLATVVRPRFEVWVPGTIGLLPRALAVLPQRPRDLLYRAVMPDQVAAADPAARAAYEARVLDRQAEQR